MLTLQDDVIGQLYVEWLSVVFTTAKLMSHTEKCTCIDKGFHWNKYMCHVYKWQESVFACKQHSKLNAFRIQFSKQDVYDLRDEVSPVRVGGGRHREDTPLYQFRGQVLVTPGGEIEPGQS